MKQHEVDRLLDAMAVGSLTDADRAELDRLAAADRSIARQREAELLIISTFAATAATGLSGARKPGADLLAQMAATSPQTPARSLRFAPVAVGAVLAGVIGVIVGTTLLAPSPETIERYVVRHDTVERTAPAPASAEPLRGVAQSVERLPWKTMPSERSDAPARRIDTPLTRVPSARERQSVDASTDEIDDEMLMVNPELRTTDTVRGRARFER